nr:NAD(P)/FAD-dependent oxidoreductase [Mangrovactinospora gilvigrisea]
MTEQRRSQRILILGGGHVGMYTAIQLLRRRRSGHGRPHREVCLVEPRSYMTYQPFLPEAAAGSISPRHVVVPLRRIVPDARIVAGRVVAADPERRTATVATLATSEDGAEPVELDYDALVVAPGSVSRTLPVPGLARHGIGFKNIEEAIGLRNHILEQLDAAASTRDPAVREAALTFVFVGGGYAGVEALAELEDMTRHAAKYHNTLTLDDLHWVLVDSGDRILPEAPAPLAAHAMEQLRRRNVDIRLATRLASAQADRVTLSDGAVLPTRTLVWTAGVRPHPVLADLGLKLDEHGRLPVAPTLQVDGHDEVFAAGDCAAVPDLTGTDGRLCAPNAQHALRQARTLADNITALLDGRPGDLAPYAHRNHGSVTSLGLHKGVAQIRGVRIKGYPAWLAHRANHLAHMPTANRKTRILTEWILSGLFKRETVSLGTLTSVRAQPVDPPTRSAG